MFKKLDAPRLFFFFFPPPLGYQNEWLPFVEVNKTQGGNTII